MDLRYFLFPTGFAVPKITSRWGFAGTLGPVCYGRSPADAPDEMLRPVMHKPKLLKKQKGVAQGFLSSALGGGSLYFSHAASKRGTKNHKFLVKTSPRLHPPEQDQSRQVATTPCCGSVTARVIGGTAKSNGNGSYARRVVMKRHTRAISTLLMRRGQLIPGAEGLAGGLAHRLASSGTGNMPRGMLPCSRSSDGPHEPGECPKTPSRLAGGWAASRCKGQTYQKKVFGKG